MIAYALDRADVPAACPSPLCGWAGRLEQTDDQDVFDSEFNTIGRTCVCPRCGLEVAIKDPQRPPVNPDG